MLLKDLLKDVNTHYANEKITGVTCDSRKVESGFAFVCISGNAIDGHLFAKDALLKGASVVITERDLEIDRQIVVEDTRAAYAKMSAEFFGRPAESLKLIGVTGTNGKTSISYMIKAILEFCGYKTGVIGTIQNMIGDKVYESANTTPDAYNLNRLFAQMRDEGCDYVVMEASSHALDQKRIYGLEFEVAAFTNLTQDHLDYHITMDNYFEAKKKLFSMSKKAVINLDDEYAERLVGSIDCETVTYSEKSNESTYSAKYINMRPDGIEYELVGYNLIKHMKIKTGGKFSVYNSLCAAVCCMELGIDVSKISEALEGMSGVKGRAEVVATDRDFSVIIDYAHTPDGLKNILSTFKEIKKGRLVCLFGCGGDRDSSKRPIMASVAAKYSDFVIVTSDNPRTEEPSKIIDDITKGLENTKTPYVIIENRIEAIKYAVQKAQTDDIIILAGKGHEDYQIIGKEKIHLDEREIVKEALLLLGNDKQEN